MLVAKLNKCIISDASKGGNLMPVSAEGLASGNKGDRADDRPPD